MITLDRDIVFLDTETLGLDRNAPIWEFAAIRLHDGHVVDVLHCQILHQQDGWLDTLPERFANDYRRRFDLQAALPSRQAARLIHTITDGAIVAGSNPSFDLERLAMLLNRFDLTPGWHYHPLDIPSMAAGYLANMLGRQHCDNHPWRSDDLSASIGVRSGDYPRHTAMGDVQWCIAQWRAMTGQQAGQ